MRLNLKGTNLTLDASIRDYLNRQLASVGKLIDLEDPAVMVDVELGQTTRHHQTGDIFRAEINLYRGKETFRAVAEAGSVTAAIDLAQGELTHELSSRKGKRLSFLRRGGQRLKKMLRSLY